MNQILGPGRRGTDRFSGERDGSFVDLLSGDKLLYPLKSYE